MSEIIELEQLKSNASFRNDEEEYSEILSRPTVSKAISKSVKPFTEADFFVKEDRVRKSQKRNKVRNENSDLLDIVKLELAAVESPVTENIIELLDFEKEINFHQKEHGLFSTLSNFFNNKLFSGWNPNTSFKPHFPNVSEKVEKTIIPRYFPTTPHDDILAKINNQHSPIQTFLNIEFQKLNFEYHPLFSLEELLSNKLQEKYTHFIQLSEELKSIMTAMKINRNTKNNLAKELKNINPNTDLKYDNTIRKYTSQLIANRQRYMNIIHQQRELLNVLKSLHSDIEAVREKTGIMKTPCILKITDKDQGDINEIKWKEMLIEEHEDLLSEIEYNYVSDYLKYKEQKSMREIGDNNDKMKKPKLNINESKIRDTAEKHVNEVMKLKSIDIKLETSTSLVTEVNQEQFSSVYYAIYVDDVFVCKTTEYTHNSLILDMNELISIEILPENQNIMIILYEIISPLAFVKMNILDIKNTLTKDETLKLVFKNETYIKPSLKYIGSGNSIKEIAKMNGIRLKSNNLFKEKMFTTCLVDVKISWKITNKDNADINRFKEIDNMILRIINGSQKPDYDTLKYIIEVVYENEVDNEFIETLNSMTRLKLNSSTNDTFDVDENSPELIRMKLIKMRSEGEFSSVENKIIPIKSNQISSDQLECLQNLSNNTNEGTDMEKYKDLEALEVQRFVGAKYVEKCNKNVQQKLNESLLKRSFHDVVADFGFFGLRNILKTRADLRNTIKSSSSLGFQSEISITIYRAFSLPERSASILGENEVAHDEAIAGIRLKSLRPFVKVSYQGTTLQSTTAIGCHPTWNQTLRVDASTSKMSSLRIHVFDQASSNVNLDTDYSSAIAFRSTDNWIGSVTIPLYSVIALGKLSGTFKLATPCLLLGYDITKQDEHRTLVPQIRQLLKKETPYLAMQISTHKHQDCNYLPLPNDSEDYIIKYLNTFLTEFRNNYPSRNLLLNYIDSSGRNKCVTEFLQPIPLPDWECFPKSRRKSDSALSKSSVLSKSSSSRSYEGKQEAEVEKSSENEPDSLYGSYDRSWKSDTDPVRIVNNIMRYVSLIPTYDVVDSHVATLSGIELLQSLHGSPIDHTILLASFFLYLGFKTYIVTGISLPRGLTTFVLTKYDKNTNKIVLINEHSYSRSNFFARSDGFVWNLYDAVSGERFDLRDASCPLKTVEFIYDDENIWINIQSSQDCESVSFDLNKSSDWLKVFNKNTCAMKLPIASDVNLYKNPLDIEPLRSALETKIKVKIQKWRSHTKTVWNRYCSSVLKEQLCNYEFWAFNQSETRPPIGQRLKQLMITYKMYGFPLNMPFTNKKSIITTLKATGVHLNDDPNVEFGLAVELFNYPNNVASVWVFLVSVTRVN